MWWKFSALGVMFIVMSSPLAAQNQPRPWGIDITPHFGYRTSMSVTADDDIEAVTAKVKFDSNASYGVGFGVRFADVNLVEFRWTRQDTEVRITGLAAPPAKQHVNLDQYHVEFTYEYVPRQWPQWARPYIMGGLGATHFSSTATSVSFTRFSFGIGGGIKAFPSPHFGFKIQGQWVPVWITPEVEAFCSVGCAIHIHGQLASQGEFTIGPVFRF
jgi:opacity protein-like surface antigen